MDPETIKALECLVCLELPRTYVHCCLQDHAVCGNCRKNVTKCPLCKADLQRRNFGLERVLETLPLPCRYDVDGCKLKAKGMAVRRTHEATCMYRTVVCFIQGCGKGVPACGMEEHLIKDHKDLHADKAAEKNNLYLIKLPNLQQQTKICLMPEYRCHAYVQISQTSVMVGVCSWNNTTDRYYSLNIQQDTEGWQPQFSHHNKMVAFIWDKPSDWKSSKILNLGLENLKSTPIKMELTVSVNQTPIEDNMRESYTLACKHQQEGCTVMFPEQVHVLKENHERNCLHAQMRCLLTPCEEVMSVGDLYKHFADSHQAMTTTGTVCVISTNTDTYCMFPGPVWIQTQYNKDTKQLVGQVYSFQPSTWIKVKDFRGEVLVREVESTFFETFDSVFRVRSVSEFQFTIQDGPVQLELLQDPQIWLPG